MSSKYNPIVDTLISTPLVNLASWTVAQKPGGAANVTVGTDDWQFPSSADAGALRALFFGQNTSGAPLKDFVLFDTRDRLRIKEFILHCNFADGLLEVSNEALSPAFTGAGAFPASGYKQDPNILIAVTCRRVDSTPPLGVYVNAGSITFAMPGFGLSLACDYPEPRNPVLGIIAPVSDKGFVLDASLVGAALVGQPIFSTLSIDPLFQTKRILVWAEMVVEHTFPLATLPVAT